MPGRNTSYQLKNETQGSYQGETQGSYQGETQRSYQGETRGSYQGVTQRSYQGEIQGSYRGETKATKSQVKIWLTFLDRAQSTANTSKSKQSIYSHFFSHLGQLVSGATKSAKSSRRPSVPSPLPLPPPSCSLPSPPHRQLWLSWLVASLSWLCECTSSGI